MATTTERSPGDIDPCVEVAAAVAVCPGPEDPSVESSLGWGLSTVLRAYVREAGAALGDLPGGPRGYHVLSAATQSLPCSQQALGKFVGVDRSVMTYLIDDLVAEGLVERQPDPDDRRARRIVVTPTGVERTAALFERLRAVEDHVLRDLSADEREAFCTALRRVAERTADDPRAIPR